MSKNPGYVTDQGFPSSANGLGKMGNFAGRGFFSLGGGKLRWNAFDHVNLFQSIKTIFSKYWTSIKIKISMTCVYKEHEVSRGDEQIYIILEKFWGKFLKNATKLGSSF